MNFFFNNIIIMNLAIEHNKILITSSVFLLVNNFYCNSAGLTGVLIKNEIIYTSFLL